MSNAPYTLTAFLRDPSSQDQGARYGCRLVVSGKEPIEHSIGEWRAYCETKQDPSWFEVSKALDEFVARQEEEDLLRSGQAWQIIKAAMNELIAGEDDLKELCFYSGLSSQLDRQQFHILVLGESQQGKSFVLVELASKLFPNNSLVINSLSPKGLLYDAKDDPTKFRNTILVVDELKDNQEAARQTLKPMTSQGQNRVVSKTVDENKRAMELVIDGMPTIWASSMEVIEDPGGQIGNRLFKAQIDESLAQSQRVERFQKDKMGFGDLIQRESRLPLAVRLVHRLMETKDFTVLNPFAEYIEQTEHSVRNRLPFYHTLLSAITYANRYRRKAVLLQERRRYLVATLSDNLTAMRLWAKFNVSHSTGLPERHQRLLEAMVDDRLYSPEDAASAYNLKWSGSHRPIGSKTAYNYLRELTEKDLVTSERRLEERYGQEHITRDYMYRKLYPELPTAPQLRLRMTGKSSLTYLDAWMEQFNALMSQLPRIDHEPLDDLREYLIDAEPPRAMSEQSVLGESADATA